MSKPVQINQVVLHPEVAFDLNDSRGTTVTVTAGVVWLTLANDIRDVLLKQGDSFVIDRDGLTVLLAVNGPATLAVTPPQPSRFGVVALEALRKRAEMGYD